jgi:GH25 family lysozyme M1 (1,4-beta-N-acetylmuramidase)
MLRQLPVTVRFLTPFARCVLALTIGVGTAAVPGSAHASTPTSGPTGLHDGMLPADSPDAQRTSQVAANTLAASAASPVGLDVASWQHPFGASIDWAQVAASGQSFAIVKATELYTDSTTGQPVLYTNPYLHSDLNGAHAAGLVIGAYAFAHPENSAIAQADDLASAIGTLPSGSLPPVLDLETSGGLSVAALVSWTHTFLDRLQADTGILPMIYTGPNFWTTYLGNSTNFATYPLWEAHYTTASAPAQIGGWNTYTLWQFTSSATIPGISGNVDQSRFNTATGATLQNLHSPVGSFDGAQVTGSGTLTVTGWAFDPDTPSVASTVHVYVDGRAQVVTANGSRPDVGAAFPAAGNQHGFIATTQVDPGAHTVCVYAIDTTDSSQHTGLGCRTATFSGSWFYLNDQNSGQANIVMSYGDPSDQVLVANTDGVGGDKLLIRRGNQYFVRNSLTTGAADYSFVYGDPGDMVLVGDWNGDGKDTLAVRRGNTFYIKNSLTTGVADSVISYGDLGDTVLVGDWNGDGVDTLAVRRGNQYFIKNSISSGVADTVFSYGNPGDTVLVGSWNGKTTGLAVRRGNTFYLKNDLTSGVADTVFSYGNPGDTVLVGDWNGDGVDSLGVRRVS